MLLHRFHQNLNGKIQMENFKIMGKKLENAKALYYEGIRDGNVREAVTKYTGERYTQHSTGVRDGIEGFVEFFEPLN